MFGKFIGAAIRIASLPLDAVNAGADIISGGDGSKRSRCSDDTPLGMLENLRDRVAETAEEIN